MKATLGRDAQIENAYRVECINADGDGGCEVALFSGQNALKRAIFFASGPYYDEWEDPEGLAGY